MAKKMKWEDPLLVNLTSAAVHGSCNDGPEPTNCTGGSGDSELCQDGNFAATCVSLGTQPDG